jgi:hypothetical protein
MTQVGLPAPDQGASRGGGFRLSCVAILYALLSTVSSWCSASDQATAAPASGNSSQLPDLNDADRHEQVVREMLRQEKFDELDAVASAERLQKKRFPGGGWQLHDTYLFISQPSASDGVEVTDADWQAHLIKLQRWVTMNPNSVTARVALADAYVKYAWFARGTEFGDLVKDESWPLFERRLQMARDVLEKASGLKDKCPNWYAVMQSVALGQSWSQDERNALLEQAIKVEPLYYYYYQAHAFALQPRWGGEAGDSEKFADEIATRIGGKQGAAVYFEIAITLDCVGCAEGKAVFKLLSWERIQKGYAAEEELYGTSNYKLNQFAHLAIRAEDQPVALQAFLHIGSKWSKDVWKSRAYFASCREWSLALPEDFMNAWTSAAGHYREPEGVTYAKRFEGEFHSDFDGVVKQCSDADKYDEGAFSLAFRVGSDGSVEQTIPWPPTGVTRCVIPKLSGHRFSAPPQGAYWVSFNIGEVKQQPFIYQGVVLPDVGR